jgi:hypothetical protein
MSSAPVLEDWTVAMLDLIDREMATDLGGHGASVEAPTPGDTPLPAAQAYTVDGAADVTSGYAVVDVHFFADDYLQASQLARTFDSKMMGYPHVVSSNGRSVLFDRVECIGLPTEIPWTEDNSVRRFRSTYSISFRRR